MISVIVPIYQVEEYLRRCVDSLLRQTYQDFELILVDDGSPDGCGAICDAYASQEPRVRAVHKPNGGLSDARNAGLHVASGDVIAFVDSDDWVAPDFLQAMISAMEREGADIVECGVEKTAGETAGGVEKTAGETTGGVEKTAGETAGGAAEGGAAFAPEGSSSAGSLRANAGAREAGAPPAAVYTSEAALLELIRDGIFHQTVWNKLYCRAVLDGIFFEKGRTNEDEFWTWQVFLRARKLVKLETPLYYYFQRPGSIMGTSFSLRRLDALDAKKARWEALEALAASNAGQTPGATASKSDRSSSAPDYASLAHEARMSVAGTCIYLAQRALRDLRGDEQKAAREKIDAAWALSCPSKEDLAPLSFKDGLWRRLARKNFWGTVRLKNLLKKGF